MESLVQYWRAWVAEALAPRRSISGSLLMLAMPDKLWLQVDGYGGKNKGLDMKITEEQAATVNANPNSACSQSERMR